MKIWSLNWSFLQPTVLVLIFTDARSLPYDISDECLLLAVVAFYWDAWYPVRVNINGLDLMNVSGKDTIPITLHRYACVSPVQCRTDHYSIECAQDQRIAMLGVNYGAKPYTNFCPKTQSCVEKQRCCQYEAGDCLVPFNETELASMYRQCSQLVQCGWFFARSTSLKGSCQQVRDETNYVWTDFQCINEDNFIDACSQHSLTGKSVHIHHSAISTNYNYNQCSCVITPEVCNTTAKLKFRSIDVRLHSISDNLTKCSTESRLELIGQRDRKAYSCEKDKFLHGFETFHTSSEKNIVLYLHKRSQQFPQNMWIEVTATLSDMNVRVTCGARSVQTAKRCPAEPVIKIDAVDEVEDVPDRTDGNKPTIIHIDPEDLDPDDKTTVNGTTNETQNPAIPAIIGGIVAGVVVLILILVLFCFIVRRK